MNWRLSLQLNDYQIRNNNKFIDHLLFAMSLKHDLQLAISLDISLSLIIRIRHGYARVSDNLIIKACKKSGLSIKEMKAILNAGNDQPSQVTA